MCCRRCPGLTSALVLDKQHISGPFSFSSDTRIPVVKKALQKLFQVDSVSDHSFYKKDLHDSENNEGVTTHPELNILECKVKWALGSIATSKASEGGGIPAELFQPLKYDAVKMLHSICQQIWKTQQWPEDYKRSVFIPFTKKAMTKNVQTTAQLHSSHILAK